MTRPLQLVSEARATGEEVYQLVCQIEPILIGVDRAKAIMACLSIALILQNPDLTPQEIQEGVRGASQWMCLYLSTTKSASDALGLAPERPN